MVTSSLAVATDEFSDFSAYASAPRLAYEYPRIESMQPIAIRSANEQRLTVADREAHSVLTEDVVCMHRLLLAVPAILVGV